MHVVETLDIEAPMLIISSNDEPGPLIRDNDDDSEYFIIDINIL